ncbi:Peptidyl-prolyl cis-trans isomerase-like 2 [Cytospora mali]|uniref:Peptidyl-prolyl cis-trans isomerase-like 2 n=1 Tax=Cytospora mali TaxID=578113 RepID=A0A194V9I5_CYTMA|nr:Peptidyl-prolyl cis-trans isomerase-like 2 [Valsa mali var. pyri (nom. inval.)]
MGKGTDKLYITHSEWSSSDAYSASVGSGAGLRAQRAGANFRRLPFNFCAASLQPFKNPVCTPEGTIFDVEVISAWLEKHDTNPVNGQPLSAKDLIKLNFARNADTEADPNAGLSDGKGDMIDPVTFKVFTDNTHIVAIRHGTYANVFAWETIEQMNIKQKNWRDLVDDSEFGRKDIITLQDPQNAESRNLSEFQYLKDGGDALLTPQQIEERKQGGVNVDALGRIGDKVLRAKEAVEKARRERESGGDINRSAKALQRSSAMGAPRKPAIQEKKLAHNAATYTTGRAAASFTSTGLTPETSGERAVLTDEEWMLKPKRVKNKGYARIETNLGDVVIELQTETAPKAVWNFVKLAQKGYYRNVVFHRNIKNFMIQGGDPTGTGKGGQSIWGKNFQDEFDGPLTHDARGMVSMANKGKNTNSSQFFITYKPAKHLDRKHTIFGKVVDGLDTLDKLERVPVDEGSRPLEDITMKNIVVFLDPFEEFLKEKDQQERKEAEKAEIQRQGGTEDDKTTWTGKRIRGDGSVEQSSGGVGKYLKYALATQSDVSEEPVVDDWEPSRKKAKTGGFGNFDNW